jgi:hypothetical protein
MSMTIGREMIRLCDIAPACEPRHCPGKDCPLCLREGKDE